MDGQDRQDTDRIFTLTPALSHKGRGEWIPAYPGMTGWGRDTNFNSEQLRRQPPGINMAQSIIEYLTLQ